MSTTNPHDPENVPDANLGTRSRVPGIATRSSRSRKSRTLPIDWRGLLVFAAATACSGDPPSTSPLVDTLPHPQPTSSEDAAGAELAFYPCSITTASGQHADAAECASITVPVRRDATSSRTVALSLKRYRRVAEPRGQLWLIAGGPGSAASDFELDADFYLGLGDGLELYFLDHRGTGRSNRLECAEQQASDSLAGEVIRDAEWSACISSIESTWGDDLMGFSSVEAATDLGEIISRTRRVDVPVFLYAVSYGTYLTQRYLRLFPTQSAGVVLDSICAPGSCDLLLEMDRQSDRIGRAIFDACGNDAICSAELGSDPWNRLQNLSTSLDAAHCATVGWSSATLRQVLGMMVTTAGLRDYMPAVVRRLERCRPEDVAALKAFQNYLSGIDTEANSFSQVVHANVVFSELSSRPAPSAEQIAQNVDELNVSMDAGMRLAAAVASWKRYPRDDDFGKLAPTSIPLLMLHGTLDPQLALELAKPLEAFYRLPHQHFVEVPLSPHDTLTQSLLDETGTTCGAEIVRQFFRDPGGALDTSCTERVLKLNFAGVSAISNLLFETDMPWYDTP